MDIRPIIIDRGFEQVAFFTEEKTGARAIVAIHTSVLGPALGGCRMLQYPNFDLALCDALRLAEGMSYKNSLAGLHLGGGKSVLIAPRDLQKGREALFEWFGQAVGSLQGRYYTAEDMGTSVEDMNAVLRSCPYVAGRDQSVGGGGDPSPHTALGVFEGMRACLERVHGDGSFKGRHVVIQGVGHVGVYLARHLADAGAKLTFSDTRPSVLEAACREFSASSVETEKVFDVPCDVFAPCAIGGILNRDSVKKLKCSIVAGAANNQLSEPAIETVLRDRGILYAPDFAINAGGVILCADELEPGGYTPTRVEERVRRIYQTVGQVLDEAAKTKSLAGDVAVRLAQARIAGARPAKNAKKKST